MVCGSPLQAVVLPETVDPKACFGNSLGVFSAVRSACRLDHIDVIHHDARPLRGDGLLRGEMIAYR